MRSYTHAYIFLCLYSLAVKGRLVVIGYISGYENDRGFVPSKLTTLPQHVSSMNFTGI